MKGMGLPGLHDGPLGEHLVFWLYYSLICGRFMAHCVRDDKHCAFSDHLVMCKVVTFFASVNFPSVGRHHANHGRHGSHHACLYLLPDLELAVGQ